MAMPALRMAGWVEELRARRARRMRCWSAHGTYGAMERPTGDELCPGEEEVLLHLVERGEGAGQEGKLASSEPLAPISTKIGKS
jgi:hypothetical protein